MSSLMIRLSGLRCLATGAVVGLVTFACGGEPPTRVDATITVLQGAGQADTIETQLPVPLKVAVRDTLGRPAANVAVDWGTEGDCGLAPAACIARVAADEYTWSSSLTPWEPHDQVSGPFDPAGEPGAAELL
jgi:hypothetical protein